MTSIMIELNSVPATDASPYDELANWRLFACGGGPAAKRVLHLVGRSAESGLVRVTSSVAAVDLKARTMTTQSGRVYRLVGQPDQNAASEAAIGWGAWARMHRLNEWQDVTEAVAAFLHAEAAPCLN